MRRHLILAGTGHRPNKLGGYSIAANEHLLRFATEALKHYQPSMIISGMALGWDQALARAAIDLAIPFTAAIPFEDQERMWPTQSQKTYATIRTYATHEQIVCPDGYSADKMQTRNEWMVDNADAILALWNGSTGGTGNCITYAHRQHKEIANLWPQWQNLSNQQRTA